MRAELVWFKWKLRRFSTKDRFDWDARGYFNECNKQCVGPNSFISLQVQIQVEASVFSYLVLHTFIISKYHNKGKCPPFNFGSMANITYVRMWEICRNECHAMHMWKRFIWIYLQGEGTWQCVKARRVCQWTEGILSTFLKNQVSFEDC